MVEPKFYFPIIPLLLINGAEGIGTGWSTSICMYNYRHICIQLIQRLKGQRNSFDTMTPFYKGFQGEISKKTVPAGAPPTFVSKGEYCIYEEDNRLDVIELPVKKWTKDYKNFIEEMMDDDEQPALVDDLREYHTNNRVHF